MKQIDNEITRKFSLNVGRFVADAIARELREYLHNTGLEYSVTKDMGWIDGYLYVSISGKETDVDGAIMSIKKWCNSMRNDY